MIAATANVVAIPPRIMIKTAESRTTDVSVSVLRAVSNPDETAMLVC